jgi:hypothetical protein
MLTAKLLVNDRSTRLREDKIKVSECLRHWQAEESRGGRLAFLGGNGAVFNGTGPSHPSPASHPLRFSVLDEVLLPIPSYIPMPGRVLTR